jgi:hypothetical protein
VTKPEEDWNSPEWILKFQAETDEYHKAVGAFTHAWADLEWSIYSVLLKYTKMGEPVGRALFSGSRVLQMCRWIEAVCENTNVSSARTKDLKWLIEQISHLNTIRDRITHWGSYATILITDTKTLKRSLANIRAARVSNALQYEINSETVRAMTRDTLLIAEMLRSHLAKRFRQLHGSGDVSTWLYKPLQPKQTKQKSAASPQVRQHQLRSFPLKPRPKKET